MAEQITINVTDQIPAVNQATIDLAGETGNTYAKSQLDEKLKDAKSGIKNTATQANAPTTYTAEAYPNGLYETYVVRVPLTMPNSWGSAVTQAELDNNYVFFDVENGVVTKNLSLKPSVSGKIIKWSAIPFANGTQVLYDGKIYESNTDTLSTDIPDVSSKWTLKIGINVITKKSNTQIFDVNNFNINTSIASTNLEVVLVGGAVTPYYDIPTGQNFLSFNGLGSSSSRRIAWVTGINGGGSLISVNSINASSATIAIPATAKSFRFFFQRPEDGDVSKTFMLNFGSQAKYESFEELKSINNINIPNYVKNDIVSLTANLSGTSPTVNASNWYKATPIVADVVMKGNTGLGYDLKRNLFIVAEYNTTISSKVLIFRSSDLVERNLVTNEISTPYRIVDLSTILDHIQGVTWDFVDDTYLALGTAKGKATSSTNSIVVKFSPIGTIIDIFELGDNLVIQVGMIDVLINGNIIIKPNLGSSAYIFSRGYSLLNRVTLISEEGIAVNKYNGDIWCADSDFTVKKYDKNYNELATYSFNTFTSESGFSNVEGMCILPDGSLVISADAFLHGGTQLGNSLFFFDFEKTVNKKRNFYLPNGNDKETEYLSEIITTQNTVTSVDLVTTDSPLKKQYRSGTTKANVSNASLSDTITNSTFFQVKILK